MQRVAAALAPLHTLSLAAGVTVANRSYNQAFFGLRLAYHPRGGLNDASIGARWNWALSPSWLVTSNLKASHLLGSAKDSPLVERPANLTVSSAIAYRF